MDDTICRGIFVLVLCLIIWLAYRWRTKDIALTQDFDPEYFDSRHPGDTYEYRCIKEQRRYGRERGGELILKDADDDE